MPRMTPRMRHGPRRDRVVGERDHHPNRIVIKFNDFVNLPYEDGAERHLEKQGIEEWAYIERRFPGSRLNRLFTSLPPEAIAKLVKRARGNHPTYEPPDFLSYFVLECPHGTPVDRLVKKLRSWPSIEGAEPDMHASEASANVTRNTRLSKQVYLKRAPRGIGAEYVWDIPGGNGEGMNIVDVERGWTLDHEDLPTRGSVPLFGAVYNPSRAHGTAVLGIICAVNNNKGCIGIAHGVSSVNVAVSDGCSSSCADRMLAAASRLGPGDVLLLEMQCGDNMEPCETMRECFDVIRLATALGIVVVEAAGNGALSLDNSDRGKRFLNRRKSSFRDSGAIMVGASTAYTSAHPPNRDKAKDGRSRLDNHDRGSNFGTRIDCHAWGEKVSTLSSNRQGATDRYRNNFGGTSSAAAIIAGAALSVQGMARAQGRGPFSPGELREIFRNPEMGTPTKNPKRDKIGVMPNLEVISLKVLKIQPVVRARRAAAHLQGRSSAVVSARHGERRSPRSLSRRLETATRRKQSSGARGSRARRRNGRR